MGDLQEKSEGDTYSSGHTEAQESNSPQWDQEEVPKGWKLSSPGRMGGIQEDKERQTAVQQSKGAFQSVHSTVFLETMMSSLQ